ncbi:hypothetical protein D3C71_2072860 [compost metagenome]
MPLPAAPSALSALGNRKAPATVQISGLKPCCWACFQKVAKWLSYMKPETMWASAFLKPVIWLLKSSVATLKNPPLDSR